MAKFGLFILKYPPLPSPGGDWFSWSTTHSLSRRSFSAMMENSQPEQQVTQESTGCSMPNTTSTQRASPNPNQPVSFSVAKHGSRLAVPHYNSTLCSRLASSALSFSFCWSRYLILSVHKRTIGFQVGNLVGKLCPDIRQHLQVSRPSYISYHH